MSESIPREWLLALPKAELHCHLDGSLRASTLVELAREYGKPLPGATVEEVADHMVVRDARDLEDYLTRFTITLSVMQRADALERVAYELVMDAARDGVRYIEIRYAPVLCAQDGLSMAQAVEAPLRGIERARARAAAPRRGSSSAACATSIPSSRWSSPSSRSRIRDKGVVGFDLAGAERGHPARLHAEAFALARRHDLAVTVHAGEGDGADSVRQAVHDCGANRLGHATRLAEDDASPST